MLERMDNLHLPSKSKKVLAIAYFIQFSKNNYERGSSFITLLIAFIDKKNTKEYAVNLSQKDLELQELHLPFKWICLHCEKMYTHYN